MKLEKQKDIGLPFGVLGLAASRDGGTLYAACLDGKIFRVNAETGEKQEFDGKHESYASRCALSPDGKTLISGGYDGALLWHDTETGKCWRRVKAHSFWIWDLSLSPDGKRVAAVSGQYLAGGEKYEPLASPEPTVRVFDTLTGDMLKEYSFLPPVLSTAFSPDGRHIAAGNMMGDMRIWDLEAKDGEPAAAFNSPDFTSWGTTKSHHYCGGIYSVEFSPDGTDLLCCGMGPMTDPMAGNGKMTWQRWAWKETPARRAAAINDGQRGSGLMETLAWRPGGAHFLMAGKQAQGTWTTAVFDAASGELTCSLDIGGRVTRAVFTAEDTVWLATCPGQPPRKDGKWPEYGRLFRCRLEA